MAFHSCVLRVWVSLLHEAEINKRTADSAPQDVLTYRSKLCFTDSVVVVGDWVSVYQGDTAQMSYKHRENAGLAYTMCHATTLVVGVSVDRVVIFVSTAFDRLQ